MNSEKLKKFINQLTEKYQLAEKYQSVAEANFELLKFILFANEIFVSQNKNRTDLYYLGYIQKRFFQVENQLIIIPEYLDQLLRFFFKRDYITIRETLSSYPDYLGYNLSYYDLDNRLADKLIQSEYKKFYRNES